MGTNRGVATHGNRLFTSFSAKFLAAEATIYTSEHYSDMESDMMTHRPMLIVGDSRHVTWASMEPTREQGVRYSGNLGNAARSGKAGEGDGTRGDTILYYSHNNSTNNNKQIYHTRVHRSQLLHWLVLLGRDRATRGEVLHYGLNRFKAN